MSTFYRIVDNQVYYGQTIQNVLHFKHFSADPATMDALMAEFRDNWVLEVRTRQNTLLVHTSLTCTMLESQFAPRSLTLNLPGTLGSSNEWKLVSAHVIRLRSATIGRHGRGRVYIAGQAFNEAQNGLVSNTTVTAWNSRLATILSVFGPSGTSDFRLVILPRNNPQGALDVVNMSLAPTEGTQRRRNVGVGI